MIPQAISTSSKVLDTLIWNYFTKLFLATYETWMSSRCFWLNPRDWGFLMFCFSRGDGYWSILRLSHKDDRWGILSFMTSPLFTSNFQYITILHTTNNLFLLCHPSNRLREAIRTKSNNQGITESYSNLSLPNFIRRWIHFGCIISHVIDLFVLTTIGYTCTAVVITDFVWGFFIPWTIVITTTYRACARIFCYWRKG